jgi:hypothetical protein
MQSEAEIVTKIRERLQTRKDIKTVETSGTGPDLVVTSADGRKIIFEIKPYSAPDAIDIAHISNWKAQYAAEGAVIASGARPPISVVEAAERLHVGILSPTELLGDIENRSLQYFFQLSKPRLPPESPQRALLWRLLLQI